MFKRYSDGRFGPVERRGPTELSVRQFLLALFAVFGVILFFQLNWAQYRGRYDDIFLRVSMSAFFSLPAYYLLLQIIHVLRVLIRRQTDICGSMLPLYGLSLFHLEWFQFVADSRWPLWRPTLFGIIGVATLFLTATALRGGPAQGKSVSVSHAFRDVNRFFLDNLVAVRDGVIRALSAPTCIAGIVVYPVSWILVAFEGVLLIKYGAFCFRHVALLPLYLIVTLLTPILLIKVIRCLTFRVPRMGAVVTVPVVIVYYLLTLYHVTENAPLDYSLLRLNADLLLHGTSYSLMADRLQMQSYLLTFFCVGSCVLLLVTPRRSRGGNVGASCMSVPSRPIRHGFLALGLYGACMVFPLENRDPLRMFALSVKEYRDREASLRRASSLLDAPYPYYRQGSEKGAPKEVDSTLPDIFLVCLESCNGLLIEDTVESGRQITPFFNSLIPHGVYIDHFYGHSVQTARGFFSLLTGVPAGFRGKEATSNPDLALRGLPAILSDYGYDTWFIKAYHDLSYDNTGEFMEKAGFDNVRSMTEDVLTEEEKRMRWGWGLQDDFFYRACFRMVDEAHERTAGLGRGGRRPLFLTTFNVSNHMMFQDIPPDRKSLYPQAERNDFRENFRNSMYLSDSCLAEFFVQLKRRNRFRNSIVILVGDHGFPAGDHSMKNEKGAWEENFRTPFLLIWEGKIEPQRLSEQAFSQVDIMPTLFDLLNIHPAHHAVGKSVFATGKRPAVLFSQPYDGIFLGAVDYPFKYLWRITGNSRYLFNLETDPGERVNLIADETLQPTVNRLQDRVSLLMANQTVIDQNRLWPRAKSVNLITTSRSQLKSGAGAQACLSEDL